MRPLAWLVGHGLAWYAGVPDIEDAAARMQAGQRVWMLAASDDERVPSIATDALREGFAASASRFSFEEDAGKHLAGGDDPRIPGLLRRAESWMKAERLL